jgi:hypothetical protein
MLLKRRETVDFDPTKKDHRAAAAAFMRRRAWGDSPLRFNHDPAFGSVADQVEKKLLAYYLSKDKLAIPELPKPEFVGSIQDIK